MTQEELKQLLKYDKSTGEFEWVDYSKACRKNKVGSKYNTGYMIVSINYKRYQLHRLAWLYEYGYMPKFIDHINGDKSDNRISNLREVTKSQNSRNMKKNTKNKSGFTGVHYNKNTSKWVAQIYDGVKIVHLGSFDNKDEAIIARCKANIRYGYHENHGR